MFDRVERLARRARRVVDRDDWTARVLGLPVGDARSAEPGLLIIQIDGLSRQRLLETIAAGGAPFLRSLLDRGTYALTPVYSGMPSTTPAVQAELFYGVTGAVPAFSFVDRDSGRIFRMYEAAAVRAVEGRWRDRRALLAGGGSYLNIYDAGAANARFCMASVGWGEVPTAHPVAAAGLVLLHLPGVVRAGGAVLGEAARGSVDLLRGLRSGERLGGELKFLQSRVAIGVVLRELCTFGASVDLARGVPVVHVNLLGYDEIAHRRGPDTAVARRALRPTDATIRRLAERARRATRRDYDVWVMSDHGQVPTLPYAQQHGRTVRDAVAEVFAAHAMVAEAHEEPRGGEQRFRARALGERLVGLMVPGLDITTQHRTPDRVTVVAQGPLGHVYSPRPLDATLREQLAAELVQQAAIPLVCAADGPGRARAWTAQGAFELPAEAAAVLGADHPYLQRVAEDLVAVCHHRDAGDLVISGWQADRPVTFNDERGAHAGPGPGETDAFLLAPLDTPLPADDGKGRRFLDVRFAAFALLDRHRPRRLPQRANRDTAVRIITYNVHSCVGMDEMVSPERIARVIARHDPDIVALQEVDVRRGRTGHVDQAREIARCLEMELQFHPTIAVAEERFGDAVLSRLPMREVRSAMLPALSRRGLEPRGALWVEVDVGGGHRLQVINTHLSLHPKERRLQVDALLGPEWLGDPRSGRDVLLCGDFNAMAWFPTCRSIATRLRDSQVGSRDRRPSSTWFGRFPMARIDHVFVDPHLEVTHVEVPDDEWARVASDHRPLVVDVRGFSDPAPDHTG
jgi:endonuclease/exonuclease/phosphatase family metal-dependent hydrolase